jgi:hypothetical protein
MKVVSAADSTVRRDVVAENGVRTRHIDYFGDLKGLDEGPQGFMVEKIMTGAALEVDEIVVTPPHYHRVRQFQLVVHGKEARIGKHETPRFSFHFVDGSSPYGPIYAGPDGIAWFTLRATADVGAYFMPGAKDYMRGRAGRNVVVNVDEKPLPTAGVELGELISPEPDGLASFRIRVGPGENTIGPPPGETGGQYYYVAGGSLVVDGRVVDGTCLAWVGPEEEHPRLTAGDEGADVLVLQFPVVTADETIDITELDTELLGQFLSPALADQLGIRSSG